MNLLSIAGFLGSGKTTLLLRVAREFSKRFNQIAIIENEIGEIGIYGKYLRQYGLEIQELFGGCICCVMQLDLIQTIKKVERIVKPEWIILEPTGAADSMTGSGAPAIGRSRPLLSLMSILLLCASTRLSGVNLL